MRVKTIKHILEKLCVEVGTTFDWLRIRSFGVLSIIYVHSSPKKSLNFWTKCSAFIC